MTLLRDYQLSVLVGGQMGNLFMLLSFALWLAFIGFLMWQFSPWFILLLPLLKVSIGNGKDKL